MGMAADLIARLKAEVPSLGGRVEGASALAALEAGNTPPQVATIAHVIPGGVLARDVQALTGFYRQRIERVAEVILSANTGRAAPAAEDAEDLIDAIVMGLAGWTPPGAFSPLTFRGCRLLSARAGQFRWQITFSAPFELRIYP